jgi:hypothetical protein
MPWCAMTEEHWRDKLRRLRGDREPQDGDWDELGSDDLMDFDVLARVKAEGHKADIERERKIQRRSE